MKSKDYVSIDLGLQGCIAYESNGVIKTYAFPKIKDKIDYSFLFDIIQNIQQGYLTGSNSNPHIIFEKLGIIFGSSKATAFSMGYQSGAMEMCCIALGIPYSMVPPKTWQKEIFEGIPEITNSKGKRDTKSMSIMAAQRLFPKVPLSFKEGLKLKDGIADALCLLEYARRKNL